MTFSRRTSIKRADVDEQAISHVAPPIGLPDVNTNRTRRQFIHRSLREHLVAEHLARLPVRQAVKLIFPHLWYDPDWEYAAPAAIVMHPRSEDVLRRLIRRAARSFLIPNNLSVIDAGWQIRSLLARIATDSGEADWSPRTRELIGKSRAELAGAATVDYLAETVDEVIPIATWTWSNNQVVETLLRQDWYGRKLAGNSTVAEAGTKSQQLGRRKT